MNSYTYMNSLPIEIENEIFSYIITCNSHHKYIINKSTLQYYKKCAEYRFCAPIKIFNKDICQICYAEEIQHLKRMSFGI